VETNDLTFNTNTLSPSEPFTGYQDNDKFLSHVAQRQQTNIHQSIHCTTGLLLSINDSNDSSNNFDLMSKQSKDGIRKKIITTINHLLLLSSCVSSVFIKRFEERALQEPREADKRLAEYKKELYEELTAGCPAEGGVKSGRSLFEFACDDHKSVRKEKR
jgi:hypothetical protein